MMFCYVLFFSDAYYLLFADFTGFLCYASFLFASVLSIGQAAHAQNSNRIVYSCDS